MRRRAFLAMIGGGTAWPFVAHAQQEQPIRIGVLPIGSPSSMYDQSLVEAFRQGLREVGLIENRHVTVDVVWVGSEPEFAPAVTGLIERGARILVPAGSSASA